MSKMMSAKNVTTFGIALLAIVAYTYIPTDLKRVVVKK